MGYLRIVIFLLGEKGKERMFGVGLVVEGDNSGENMEDFAGLVGICIYQLLSNIHYSLSSGRF